AGALLRTARRTGGARASHRPYRRAVDPARRRACAVRRRRRVGGAAGAGGALRAAERHLLLAYGMAPPPLTRHRVPGVLGDILIDVRAGGRDSPRPATVVVHGFKGFKDWGLWPALAERLARAGFSAVTLNLSGSGVDDAGEFVYPERFGHNTFSAELQDVRRVLDALAAGELGVAPPTTIGLLGHSR